MIHDSFQARKYIEDILVSFLPFAFFYCTNRSDCLLKMLYINVSIISLYFASQNVPQLIFRFLHIITISPITRCCCRVAVTADYLNSSLYISGLKDREIFIHA